MPAACQAAPNLGGEAVVRGLYSHSMQKCRGGSREAALIGAFISRMERKPPEGETEIAFECPRAPSEGVEANVLVWWQRFDRT